MSFTLYILTAIALIFIIEGLVYALFPGGIKKMFEMALMMPGTQLRGFGVSMVVIGFLLLWFLQSFSNG